MSDSWGCHATVIVSKYKDSLATENRILTEITGCVPLNIHYVNTFIWILYPNDSISIYPSGSGFGKFKGNILEFNTSPISAPVTSRQDGFSFTGKKQ